MLDYISGLTIIYGPAQLWVYVTVGREWGSPGLGTVDLVFALEPNANNTEKPRRKKPAIRSHTGPFSL